MTLLLVNGALTARVVVATRNDARFMQRGLRELASRMAEPKVALTCVLQRSRAQRAARYHEKSERAGTSPGRWYQHAQVMWQIPVDRCSLEDDINPAAHFEQMVC